MEHCEFCIPVKGSTLDRYLERGWYRIGFLVFTTHTITLGEPDKIYHVWWLRYDVPRVQFSNTLFRIMKMNIAFDVSVHLYMPTEEMDALYTQYFQSLEFTPSANLGELLGNDGGIIFESYVIQVRDNGRLIACGIFDKGGNTIAGIVNFYDPAYKRYSPGKFLIIQKLLYCRDHNIPWYYPGYFSTDNPVFDYKLFLDKGATEVYLPEQDQWESFHQFSQHQKSGL